MLLILTGKSKGLQMWWCHAMHSKCFVRDYFHCCSIFMQVCKNGSNTLYMLLKTDKRILLFIIFTSFRIPVDRTKFFKCQIYVLNNASIWMISKLDSCWRLVRFLEKMCLGILEIYTSILAYFLIFWLTSSSIHCEHVILPLLILTLGRSMHVGSSSVLS